MWHIELVKNKYESLEDLYSLLQYVFRLNKTADDSRRANIITDDLTGCLPAMIPDIQIRQFLKRRTSMKRPKRFWMISTERKGDFYDKGTMQLTTELLRQFL